MFCHNCGKEVVEGSKFCSYCGAAQNQMPPKTSEQVYHVVSEKKEKQPGGAKIWKIAAIVLAVLVVLLLLASLGSDEDKDSSSGEAKVQTEAVVEETKAPETEAPEMTVAPETTPDDGWYKAKGATYYYDAGAPVTGLQEIDNDLYYFDADGKMQSGTDISYNGNVLELNSDGQVSRVCYAEIPSEWSTDKFRHGNAKCSFREMDFEVVNCTSLEFYLSAEGNHGANVNGEWKVHIRSNGSWEHVKTFSFKEPSGTITIRFDSPTDFDAIVAYPTKRGNASYGSYFAAQNVWCRLK